MKAICPHDEQLARWIEGTLGDADQSALTDHLASCDPCRRGLALAWIALNESAAAGLSSDQERAVRAALAGGSGCPEEVRIARWLDGTLADAERAPLMEHLGACDRCRRAAALAKITIDTDPARALESGVRRAVHAMVRERTACPDDEKLASLLDGRLDSAERALVLEHCGSCDDCRRAVALARLSKDEPIRGLTPVQERAARRIALRTAPGWGWLPLAMAAAALVAVTFIAVLVLRPEKPEPSTVKSKADPERSLTQPQPPRVDEHVAPAPPAPPVPKPEPKVTPDPEPPKPEPPKVDPPPESPKPEPPPEPEPPKEEPKPKRDPGRTRTDLAALFDRIDVLEVTGALTGAKPESSAGWDDLYATESGATFNLQGRALVSLDRQSEIAVARARTGDALVIAMQKGRAFLDTVKNDLALELWYADRQFVVPAASGRAMLDVTSGTLKMTVLAGQVDVRGGTSATAGHTIVFAAAGLLKAKADADAVRAALVRANELRPRQMTLCRADFGRGQPLAAGQLGEEGKVGYAYGTCGRDPSLPQPIEAQVWIGVQFPQAVRCTSQTELVLRCRTNATKLNVVVDGFLKETPVKPTGNSWAEIVISLRGAEKEGVEIVDEDFRSVYVGAKNGSQLDLDVLQVRRRVD